MQCEEKMADHEPDSDLASSFWDAAEDEVRDVAINRYN